MRLFQPPKCPKCEHNRVQLVHTARSFLRLLASVVTALLSFELIELRWRCAQCGAEFFAVGDKPTSGGREGFEIGPRKKKD